MSQNSSERKTDFPPSDPIDSPTPPHLMDDRKEVFRMLVMLQDLGETVEDSRARVTAQFRISHEDLMGIEREGIALNWPPL